MVHYSISQIIDVHVYQVYAWATCSKQVIEVSVVQRGDGSQANRFAYVLVSSACVCVCASPWLWLLFIQMSWCIPRGTQG